MSQACKVSWWLSKALALVAALLIPALPAVAGDQDIPKLSNGTLYKLARQALVNYGSVPVPVPSHGPNDCNGVPEICATYPEAVRCEGTDHNGCLFRWRSKNGTPYLVFTDGEELRDLTVVGIRTPDRWDDVSSSKW